MSVYNQPIQSVPIDQPVTTSLRRISWGAIFAGVIVTIVLQLLLTVLGVGLGAASVDPLQQSQPGEGLGIGAAIWLLLSTLISIFVGARVAGNLSGKEVRSERMMHGVLTWGTTTILSMLFLATTASSLLGGAATMLGGAAAARRNDNNSRVYAQPGLSPTSQPIPSQQNAREVADVAAKRVSQAAL